MNGHVAQVSPKLGSPECSMFLSTDPKNKVEHAATPSGAATAVAATAPTASAAASAAAPAAGSADRHVFGFRGSGCEEWVCPAAGRYRFVAAGAKAADGQSKKGGKGGALRRLTGWGYSGLGLGIAVGCRLWLYVC